MGDMVRQQGLVVLLFGLLAWLVMPSSTPASAQSPAAYYAGKQVKMIIGLGAGGGYDLWARTVARHIGQHLPGNPTVISQNMEGAGSFRAAPDPVIQDPKSPSRQEPK
jgi:tripartite-type tricarboxylate transporter receptor subunit TctC